MPRLLRSALGLWAIWVALLVAFMLVRPGPSTPTFWFFLVAVLATGGFLSQRQRDVASKDQGAYAAWSSRLAASGAIVDVEDDGHLYEWLDPLHWQVVFEALESLPREDRSLRQVLSAKFPEALP
jgi:hypothetical protein